MSSYTMAKEIVERIIHGNHPIEEEIEWVAEKIQKYAANSKRIGEILMEEKMSKELKGNLIRDIPDGKVLTDELPEGELLVSEGPDGEKLWKKKKKLNEDGEEEKTLNE